MTEILNLTLLPTSSEQLEAGVVDAPAGVHEKIQRLLTSPVRSPVPQWGDLEASAQALAQIAEDQGATSAMIGGLSALTGPLTAALQQKRIEVCFDGARPRWAW